MFELKISMGWKVYIVIAAYNEKDSIARVIDDLHKHGYKNIIVVDDGSKDNTTQIAERKKVMVLQHILNRGQGAALKTGIDYAVQQGADIIITFDADGQHQAKEIKNLIKPVTSGKAEVALGSRFLKDDSNIPFMRKLLLKGSVLIQRFFYGINLTDAHNGFRALSRKAAQKIEITADRMAHASQIIDEISKKKIRYTEVPVTILYTQYSLKKGTGSFSQALKVLWRMIVDKINR